MSEKDDTKADARRRIQGFHDGYAKRVAREKNTVYQQAWRRGVEARAADERPWRYTR